VQIKAIGAMTKSGLLPYFSLLFAYLTTICGSTTALPAQFLVFSDSKTLRFLSVDDNTTRILSPIPLLLALDVDYDARSQQIYWTDYYHNTISRSGLQGGDLKRLVRGLSTPAGLAVDWVSNLLYFTDQGLAVVGVASLDGQFAMILFDSDMQYPRAIALDPENGLGNITVCVRVHVYFRLSGMYFGLIWASPELREPI
jgi:hypothetical protein